MDYNYYFPWSPKGEDVGLIWCKDEWDKLQGICKRCNHKLQTTGHECEYSSELEDEWCHESIDCENCGTYFTEWDGWNFEEE